MEIKQAKVVVKLDKEERDNLINTILLLEKMRNGVDCVGCPFKDKCDEDSDSQCFLYTLIQNINYINKNCE